MRLLDINQINLINCFNRFDQWAGCPALARPLSVSKVKRLNEGLKIPCESLLTGVR